MAAISLSIFDRGGGAFGPLVDRRAAFDLQPGVRMLRERIEDALGAPASGVYVPDALADVYREREPALAVNTPIDADATLCVNGQWCAFEDEVASAARTLKLGEALVTPDGRVIAAHLTPEDAGALARSGFSGPPQGITAKPIDSAVLIDRPWHLLDQLEPCLASDLAELTPRIAPSASVHASAVLDETSGPVVIAENATVGGNAVLEGPCYIGPSSVVRPLTLVRRNTVLGPVCKVGGEISFSIMAGYSNKGHDGFLGHALIGQWCNFGAATVVSNLKTTYGPVRVQLEPDAPPEDSGRAFCGPMLGDFVRTAIGTRLPTGACLGTGAMIACEGFAPKHARRFGFFTAEGCQPTDLERFLAMADAMMARRDQRMGDSERELLTNLHASYAGRP